MYLQRTKEMFFCGYGSYSRKNVVRLEQYVIFTLNYELCPPTSLFFMETLATLKLTGCLYDTTLKALIE